MLSFTPSHYRANGVIEESELSPPSFLMVAQL